MIPATDTRPVPLQHTTTVLQAALLAAFHRATTTALFDLLRPTTVMRHRVTTEKWRQVCVWEKLAESEEGGEALEHANEGLVRLLYSALASGDAAKVGELVDEDLEWWFYGPRSEQHMMRLLTGVTSCDTFAFQRPSIRSIGNRVFVEGEAPSSSSRQKTFWVHIWTLKDKRITQLREYFNTAILVTDLKPTTPTPHEIQHHPCVPVWQNHLWKSKEGRELPGLILAI